MAPPLYYSAVDGSGVATGNSVTSATLQVLDGSNELGYIYISDADIPTSTHSLVGTDSTYMELIVSKNTITLYLKAPASHKTKGSYSVNIIGSNDGGATTSVLSVTGTVIGNVTPTFTSSANKTILDGDRDAVHQFATDEQVSLCTFALDTPANGDDNSLFTCTPDGVLSLATRASYNEKPTYTVKVTATAPYGTWQTGQTAASKTKQQTLNITVTDGSPLFLESANGVVKIDGSSYIFTVADGLTNLSNLGSHFTTDPAFFTVIGTDASYFNITPATGTRSKTATLSLKAIAKYSNKPSYSASVVATDSTGNQKSIPITVSVNSDTTSPVLTHAAINTGVQGTGADDHTFTVRDGLAAAAGFFTITADEGVAFTKSGADHAYFTLTSTSNVTTVSFTSAVPINTKATYNFAITATDTSNNSSISNITVKVLDKSAPVITSYSPIVTNSQSSYTNAKTVPITFTSNEKLFRTFTISDFTLLGPGQFDATNSIFSDTSATLYVLPSLLDADDGVLNTVKLIAGTISDFHDAANVNVEVSHAFKYSFYAGIPEIIILGDSQLIIPQGRPYLSDAGATCTGLTVVSSNNIDVKTPGTYFVTYTVTDPSNNNNKRSASRTVTVSPSHLNARPKPTIVVTGGNRYVKQNLAASASFTDTASASASAKNYDGSTITIVRINNVNIAVLGNYTCTYSGVDLIYLDLDTVTRPVTVQLLDPSAVGGVSFTLGDLNASFEIANILGETTTASVPDTLTNTMMGVEVNMPASQWNSIFYLAPEDPIDGGNGLSDFSDLANINVFGTDPISYKVDPTNLQIIPTLKTVDITINKSDRTVNPTNGTVNDFNNTSQKIAEVIIRRWAFDLFAKDLTTNVPTIFNNYSTVLSEINNKFESSAVGTLDAALKSKLTLADNKTNNDKTLSNYTRQLMLQLHENIAPNGAAGDNASRLTTSGIFDPNNKVTTGALQGYFPFKFLAGDKLTFSMTFTDPQNTPQSYYMLQGVELSPQPVSIKIVVTML